MSGVAILGSTGSIGTQALEVIRAGLSPSEVVVLSAHSKAALLIEQAREFRPKAVVIVNETYYAQVCEGLAGLPIAVMAGAAALEEVVARDDVDMVLAAIVGFAGLFSTAAAIRAGKDIALANKETLVVGGQFIMDLVREYQVGLWPVDSEHAAVQQCLVGEDHDAIETVWLTASGGPFRGYSKEQLQKVTRAQALRHPNWEMGAKITIDSATLMNKGLELIEARWMFDLAPEQLDVVVHPESIIHAMVGFVDGNIKAQLGPPDMRLPIQYALNYGRRLSAPWPRFNPLEQPALHFEAPDREAFPCLHLAQEAMAAGGSATCVLNAANEVAVEQFLNDELSFAGIATKVQQALDKFTDRQLVDLDELALLDKEVRRYLEA